MNQLEYSDYVQKGIIEAFPFYKEYCSLEGEILTIEIESPQKTLTLWITTYDEEITIGLNQNKDCLWHTHMSLFGAYEPEDELREAINLIENIINGKELIVRNSENQFYISDDQKKLKEKKKMLK